MYWREPAPQPAPPESPLVDLAFKIRCPELPLRHARALRRALVGALPWFETEPGAGLHLIHVAGSQNGWLRPDGDDDRLCLSKRTKLILRIPETRVAAANRLCGMELTVGTDMMAVGKSKTQRLYPHSTLLARYLVAPGHRDESEFEDYVVTCMEEMDIRVRRLLCGKSTFAHLENEEASARSVLLADLSARDSIRLQTSGIGPGRTFGCGIFIPHKSLDPVDGVPIAAPLMMAAVRKGRH